MQILSTWPKIIVLLIVFIIFSILFFGSNGPYVNLQGTLGCLPEEQFGWNITCSIEDVYDGIVTNLMKYLKFQLFDILYQISVWLLFTLIIARCVKAIKLHKSIFRWFVIAPTISFFLELLENFLITIMSLYKYSLFLLPIQQSLTTFKIGLGVVLFPITLIAFFTLVYDYYRNRRKTIKDK